MLDFSVFSFLFVSTSATDCLERHISEMTCYVSSGLLNSTTTSFKHSLLRSLFIIPLLSIDACTLGVKCMFAKSEVTLIQGSAEFISNDVVQVNGERFSAKHILIATGGTPAAPTVPGSD